MDEAVAWYSGEWTVSPYAYLQMRKQYPDMACNFKPSFAAKGVTVYDGLTPAEIDAAWEQLGGAANFLKSFGYRQFAQAIEQAFAQKNGKA